MKVLLSWLNDYVKIDDISVEDIVKNLTVSGFEVEEVIDKEKGLENVISVKITKIQKHPNADKLVICTADAGDRTYQIVTGAKNMQEGDMVALALNGAILPIGKEILSGEIRGEKSEGMFCGGEELGIDNSIYAGAETDGLLILKPDVKTGVKIAEILGLNEVVLDISVLPNRPDCNSIVGIARELSAIFGRDFKMPKLTYKTVNIDKKIKVSVSNPESCNRYIGTVISNIKNIKTPAFIQKRLVLLGHTPYNIFVDITNYILCEIGQPLHAFDYSKINDNEIIVRNAKEGETIIALDEKEYTLSSRNLVIADTINPLVIAGIMGGLGSGTYPETKDVFLESAVFNFANIRRSSIALGLSSSSSIRYSKGVSFDSAEIGIKRALNIISDLNLGDISEQMEDIYTVKPDEIIIESDIQRINDRLSLNLSGEEMIEILNALQIKSELKNDKIISIVPVFRTDLTEECDISEEIARIYGIDNTTMSHIVPTFSTIGELTHTQNNIDLIKQAVVGEGYNEMINYRFISPANVKKMNQNPDHYIKILNPIGQDYSIMRKNLAVSTLTVISNNQKMKNENLKLFELSTVFIPKTLPLTDLPEEKQNLVLAVNTNNEDFYSLKASLNEIVSVLGVNLEYRASSNDYMHPGKTADVYLYNHKIGEIGEIHPTVADNFKIKGATYLAEIDLTTILERNADNKKGDAPSKLPLITRDLSLIVNKEIPASKIIKSASKFKNEIEKVILFDVYEGNQIEDGFKSISIKLYIRQPEKTLTELQINEIVGKVLTSQLLENGAKLREV